MPTYLKEVFSCKISGEKANRSWQGLSEGPNVQGALPCGVLAERNLAC